MESLCLFTRQQALKIGYFYWLRVKSLNHLHTKLNLGYLKGTKFCLESKASFIDISSIASFKAGVHVKAVFTSLNTAFLPISRSRFKRR